MTEEIEPKIVIVQTVNRRGETLKMRGILADELPLRLLRDGRVQELVGPIDQLKTPSHTISARVAGIIIERGRRPIRVIPLTVSGSFTPTP